MIQLTRAQVREIDRRANEEYHIPGIVLMENAARAAAVVAWEMIGREPGKSVTIFSGPGNNGGDGLAVARHLHNRGAAVDVVPVFDPQKLTGDALTNWRIVEAMRIQIVSLPAAEQTVTSQPDLVIDALLGTGATGAPRGRIAEAIRLINAAYRGAVLAIDVPSGLDCDTGEPLGECIRAARTITFVAPKPGFASDRAKPFVGQLVVGDIGCPVALIESVARSN